MWRLRLAGLLKKNEPLTTAHHSTVSLKSSKMSVCVACENKEEKGLRMSVSSHYHLHSPTRSPSLQASANRCACQGWLHLLRLNQTWWRCSASMWFHNTWKVSKTIIRPGNVNYTTRPFHIDQNYCQRSVNSLRWWWLELEYMSLFTLKNSIVTFMQQFTTCRFHSLHQVSGLLS